MGISDHATFAPALQHFAINYSAWVYLDLKSIERTAEGRKVVKCNMQPGPFFYGETLGSSFLGIEEQSRSPMAVVAGIELAVIAPAAMVKEG